MNVPTSSTATAFGRAARAGGHLQHLADGLDPELVAVTVDVGHHHLCGRSSSAAKKAGADFKIALARRNSRFFCSKRAIRSESAVDVPGRSPPSLAARFTQVLTDSTP